MGGIFEEEKGQIGLVCFFLAAIKGDKGELLIKHLLYS